MRWIWIDRILELNPGRRLVAIKHVTLGEDAVQDHFDMNDGLGPDRPVLPGSVIIEGMAQTAGMLVGHARRFREKVILAKIGRAELERDAFPGATLRFTATIDRIDDLGAATSGVVELLDPALCEIDGPLRDPDTALAAVHALGRVDLVFSHIDNNMSGLAFPAENFVFGESFKTLLRVSGLESESV